MLNGEVAALIGVLPESRLSTAVTSVVMFGTRSDVLITIGDGAPTDSTPFAFAV